MTVSIRTYDDAEEFLNSHINYERMLGESVRYDTKTFDLDNFRNLLSRLGNPHLQYPSIHVAGTKGKGSTCAYLHEVYKRTGLRVGLYTSPHLQRYTERIVVSGNEIREDAFAALLTDLANLYTGAGNFRTVFEYLTAAAFVHFARERVDVAIVETGLGGRLDSTNVFSTPTKPHVNVITSIGLDHTHILGETIEEIAREKAGIIRAGSHVVLAAQPEQWADTVWREVAARSTQVNTHLFDAGELLEASPQVPGGAMLHSRRPLQLGGELARALEKGLRVKPKMQGQHQLVNATAAMGALVVMENARGPAVKPAVVREAIDETVWPGRFEVVLQKPVVIVDGAHCALSAEALGDTYRGAYGEKPVVLVAGFMRDKAAADMCRALRSRLKVVRAYCCAPPSPRALQPDQAAHTVATELGCPADAIRDPDRAVRSALHAAHELDAAVVVFGSMYLVHPAREAITRATD